MESEFGLRLDLVELLLQKRHRKAQVHRFGYKNLSKRFMVTQISYDIFKEKKSDELFDDIVVEDVQIINKGHFDALVIVQEYLWNDQVIFTTDTQAERQKDQDSEKNMAWVQPWKWQSIFYTPTSYKLKMSQNIDLTLNFDSQKLNLISVDIDKIKVYDQQHEQQVIDLEVQSLYEIFQKQYLKQIFEPRIIELTQNIQKQKKIILLLDSQQDGSDPAKLVDQQKILTDLQYQLKLIQQNMSYLSYQMKKKLLDNQLLQMIPWYHVSMLNDQSRNRKYSCAIQDYFSRKNPNSSYSRKFLEPQNEGLGQDQGSAPHEVNKQTILQDGKVMQGKSSDLQKLNSLSTEDSSELPRQSSAQQQWSLQSPQSQQQQKETIVIDVGCGIGLLSMFACQAGAKQVYAFELNESLALLAMAAINNNGMTNIQVFMDNACNIDAQALAVNYKQQQANRILQQDFESLTLAQKQQYNSQKLQNQDYANLVKDNFEFLIVHEIFGTDPFSEGVLPTLSSVKRGFINQGFKNLNFLPGKLEVYAVLMQLGDKFKSTNMVQLSDEEDQVHEIDLEPLAVLQQRKVEVQLLELQDVLILSMPQKVLEVNFNSPSKIPLNISNTVEVPLLKKPLTPQTLYSEGSQEKGIEQKSDTEPKSNLIIDSVLYYFEAHLDEQNIVSTAPGQNWGDHWMQNIEMLNDDLQVQQSSEENQCLRLKVDVKTDRIYFEVE